MRHTTLSLPVLGLIAGTRAMIGAGIGLLVAERLSNDKRRAIAWTLITVGALTSIPLGALALFGVDRRESANGPGRCTRARAMSH